MTTENTIQRPGLLVVDAGPERIFRVGPASTTDPAATGLPLPGPIATYSTATDEALGQIPAVTAQMLTGPWLNGPAGPAPGGTLGVLIDGASAYAALLGRPEANWSVSAEISLDLCGPMPGDGTVLTADARILGSDAHGGLSVGMVRDEDGRILGQFRQHTRWVPGPADIPADIPADFGEQALVPSADLAEPANLTELLGARVQTADGGAVIEVPVVNELMNPLGNMHGGVIFTAVDLAAQAALLSAGGPVRTASVHVAYPRPLTPGAPARFKAQVQYRGRSFGIVQVTSRNQAGKPCVIATVTTARD
jgi:uncharacterized protein (TIGR00369 family)